MKNLVFSISILAFAIFSSEINAATYNVADGDVNGLIAAINSSNSNPGPDVINLAPGGTYTLTYIAGPDSWHGHTGLPIVQGVSETLRESLTINGNGSTIQRSSAPGTPEFRIFHALYANVILDGVTIKGGYGQGSRCGGGGLYLNVTDTIIRNSTITENFGFEGGGICNNNASNLTIENSTVSHNTGPGGEINNHVATLSISNSTVYDDYPHTGRGDTIVNAFSPPGSIVIKNSIIASPTGGDGIDCYGFTPVSLGHNIYSDSTCGQNVSGGDLIVPALQLGSLANNGGLTPTHALLAGSQAIDAIPVEDCTNIAGVPVVLDQRGTARPIGAGCDIGSVEQFLQSRWAANGNTFDIVGTNHGISINGTSFTTGVSGQAFDFDGIDDRISVPNSPDLNVGTGDFTVGFFARFNDLANNENGLIHKDAYSAGAGWLFNICNNCAGSQGIGIETRNPAQAIHNNARYPTSNFQTGVWYHIAAVRQSNVLHLYIDGILRVTVAEGVPTNLDSIADLEFGSLNSGSRQYFDGSLDEINFFRRALTGPEIHDLAEVGDSTSPVISPTITGTLGNNSWYTSDIEVSWSVTDDESAVDSSTGCNPQQVTEDTAGVTFTCTATSGGGTSSESVTIKRDATAPVITVNSPTNGSYLLNQAATVSFSCSDAISGIASCDGSSADGSALDTSSTGAKSFTVNSTDNAGNAATATVNYTVGYGVQVLYDQTKAHKAGSTVPIKIRLVDANGANVSSPDLLPHAISVIQVSSQASTEFGDAGNSNPDFDFRYDADLGGYIYNLKTTGFGTGSYTLNFTAGGPTPVYSVGFQVRQ